MPEGETGHAVKKGHGRGTGIEAVLVPAPRLQCAARDVQHLGCLTLGKALGVQSPILRKRVSTFAVRPALGPILIATVLVWDARCHRSLLSTPFALTS
jgi:hypothetical protein